MCLCVPSSQCAKKSQESILNMHLKRVLFIIAVLFCSSPIAQGRVVVNGANYDAAFASDEKCFVVDGQVDLKGRSIKLKENCTLSFLKDGKLFNGHIIGNNTKLCSLRAESLGVTLSGTWLISKIDDVFFDQSALTDTQILDNITVLQSGRMRNTIILRKPLYQVVLSEEHKVGLILKSNTVLKSSSNILVRGNNLISYSVIKVGDASNVRINGGHITGDVETHIFKDGTTSEWGFGISISKAKNVVVEGVCISKCIGDGIYVGGGNGAYIGDYSQASKDIVLRDILSIGNRRQGVSITYADGVTIKNCVLANTGAYGLTSPGCGLDIEPNEGQSVRNVSVLSCEFYKNGTIMDASIGGYKTEKDVCNVEGILFKNCSFEGKLSIRTGSVVVKRCTLGTLDIHLAKMPKEKVLFDHCQINGGSGVLVRSLGGTTDRQYAPEYRFKSCSFTMSEAMTPAMFSSINHKGNEVADFVLDNCSFSFPQGSQHFDMVQAESACSFKFSKCQIDSQERTLDMDNTMYKNCRIR